MGAGIWSLTRLRIDAIADLSEQVRIRRRWTRGRVSTCQLLAVRAWCGPDHPRTRGGLMDRPGGVIVSFPMELLVHAVRSGPARGARQRKTPDGVSVRGWISWKNLQLMGSRPRSC